MKTHANRNTLNVVEASFRSYARKGVSGHHLSRHSRTMTTIFFRIGVTVAVATFGSTLLASRGFAQRRGGGGGGGGGGMHPPIAAAPPHTSPGYSSPEGGEHEHGRSFLNNSGYLFPSFYDLGDDYGPESEIRPQAPQILVIPLQAEPPAAPTVRPAPTLLLENHGGQWVRVPTGNEIPAASQPGKADPGGISAPARPAAPRSGYTELPQAAAHTTPLPPAVIVYHDGHTEELTKYMIQGNDLYTIADYYSTGAWTRKIPLSELDIPASMKLNKERGAKFNLPSGPNEVAVRF